MHIITSQQIQDAVARLCVQANLVLRPDVLRALKRCLGLETNKRAREILKAIIANGAIARREKLAVCQDTGMPVVFVELGQEARVSGNLPSAIQKGVAQGYGKGYLRNSIVADPLKRGAPAHGPAVIHTDIVRGNKIKFTVLPKGFGCENKSRLKMFKPTAEPGEIKRFILETVKSAGPDACPPYIVGVGIGGTADYACLLAKKALMRPLYASRKSGIPSSVIRTAGKRYTLNAKLEAELLREINNLNIGPMGLGGKATALAVQIETFPTHIAGLPVAVNISCHALRSAAVSL